MPIYVALTLFGYAVLAIFMLIGLILFGTKINFQILKNGSVNEEGAQKFLGRWKTYGRFFTIYAIAETIILYASRITGFLQLIVLVFLLLTFLRLFYWLVVWRMKNP